MWKAILISLSILSPLAALPQTDGPRIASIRQTYERTNRDIAAAEKDFASSEIFFDEFVANRGGTTYPAVGNFKRTTRVYYTYGNREHSPYPNRVVKITLSTERAAVRSSTEFYFDPSGQMVFAFENDGETQHRLYFTNARLIRWQRGQQILNARSAEATAKAKTISAESVRLLKLFFLSQE